MRKFNFKLQKILDIREKLELEQKNILTKAASEYQQLLLRKDDNIQKVILSREIIYSEMKTKEVSIQSLRNLDHLQVQVNQLTRSLDPQIEEKFKKMEKERIKYNKLVKDKKSIEILKNNELKKYKIAQQRALVSDMDEIARNFTKN
ncbi:MAG: hypothetical protein KFW21_02010 [Spirochaetota bacterium]|nr:hypothetical protein [Spirochaetota bacterium]